MSSVCSTCGTDFVCFDGPQEAADGWFLCPRRCMMCGESLTGAVMEHPGLGATIHLRCCPVPEPEDLPQVVV